MYSEYFGLHDNGLSNYMTGAAAYLIGNIFGRSKIMPDAVLLTEDAKTPFNSVAKYWSSSTL
jgi:hypothetical protein